MFRVVYWAGSKISTEILNADSYEIDEGMFDLLDKDGNVVLSVRRSAIISAVRLSALVKEQSGGAGHGKTTTTSGTNVRLIKQSDGQD
jgi:hypothetical protein